MEDDAPEATRSEESEGDMEPYDIMVEPPAIIISSDSDDDDDQRCPVANANRAVIVGNSDPVSNSGNSDRAVDVDNSDPVANSGNSNRTVNVDQTDSKVSRASERLIGCVFVCVCVSMYELSCGSGCGYESVRVTDHNIFVHAEIEFPISFDRS